MPKIQAVLFDLDGTVADTAPDLAYAANSLRLADGVPMAYEHSALPLSVLPRPQELDGSLYLHLARSGAAPVRAVQHLRAINATADMATHLQVPEGAALLWVSRVAHSADGSAIEFTQTHCRSDYYAFVAELRSTP